MDLYRPEVIEVWLMQDTPQHQSLRSAVLFDFKRLLTKGALSTQPVEWQHLSYPETAQLVRDIINLIKEAKVKIKDDFLYQMFDMARDLFMTGHVDQAESLLLTLAEECEMQSLVKAAQVHTHLGDLYQLLNMSDFAINHYEVARDHMSLATADTRLDLIEALEALAILHEIKGHDGRSTSCYQEIYEICMETSLPDDCRAINGLASLLRAECYLEDPILLEKIAISILARTCNEEDLTVRMNTLITLADLYNSQGKHKLASKVYKIVENTLGVPGLDMENSQFKVLAKARRAAA